MLNFIRKLIPNGIWRACFYKVLRWLAATAASSVATLLMFELHKHGFSTGGHIGTLVGDVAEGVGALVTSIGALGISLWDAKLVDTKMRTAAATGEIPDNGGQLKAMEQVEHSAVAQAPANQAELADAMNKAQF